MRFMLWVLALRNGLPVVLKKCDFTAKQVFNCPSVTGAEQFRVVLFRWSETSFGVWQSEWFWEAEQRSDGFQLSADVFVAENSIHQHFTGVREVELNAPTGEQLDLW